MTELVACMSLGKGTWVPVIRLIESGNFEKVFLIANQFAKDKYQAGPNVEWVIVDPDNQAASQMRDLIIAGLKGKVAGFDVALDLTSGTGKEHMATLSALFKLGVGIRLVQADQNKVVSEF